ncbi:MAG: hypothetical protein AAFO96_06170 [Bacteroidota bacterium]
MKTISQVLSFLALCLLIGMIDNPVVAILSGIFWLFVWTYNIYDKVNYRNKKYQNEIRFPTQNDSYFKITSLSLGCMLTIGMVIWIALMTEFSLIPVVGLIAGLLILTNGIIDVPKGQLKFDNSKLKLTGVQDGIELNDIQSINIDSDKITIHKESDASIKLERLKLNENWIGKISAFLSERLHSDKVKITRSHTV